jgi:hypothetical protein
MSVGSSQESGGDFGHKRLCANGNKTRNERYESGWDFEKQFSDDGNHAQL